MLRRWVVAPSVLLGAFAACTDDPPNDPLGIPDGGSFDATTDRPATPDSSLPSDAGSDADVVVDSGPVGPVTVLVEKRNVAVPVPRAGIVCVFHDTDGAVLRATTGADGRATVNVHAGATATVLYRYDDTYTEITTVFDVGLGETIEITDEPAGLVPTAQFAFTGEPPAGLADGTEFRFFTGQGGSGGHYTPNVYTTQTDYPLVDGTGFRFVGFAPSANFLAADATKYVVAVVPKNPDGGTTQGTALTADWGDVATGPLSLSGTTPAGVTAWTYDLGQAHGAAYYPIVHDEGATATIPASYPRVPAALLADVHTEGTFTFASTSVRSVHIQRAANTGTIAENLAAYLPPITAGAVTGTSAAPIITLTTTATFASPMTGHHRITGERTTLDGAPADTDWVVVHRANATSVTLPTLPADLAAGLVPQTWTLSTASLFESPQITYETIRKNVRQHQRRTQGQPSRAFYPKTPFDSHHVRFTN